MFSIGSILVTAMAIKSFFEQSKHAKPLERARSMNEEDEKYFIPTRPDDHWTRFKLTHAEAEPLRKFVNVSCVAIALTLYPHFDIS